MTFRVQVGVAIGTLLLAFATFISVVQSRRQTEIMR